MVLVYLRLTHTYFRLNSNEIHYFLGARFLPGDRFHGHLFSAARLGTFAQRPFLLHMPRVLVHRPPR